MHDVRLLLWLRARYARSALNRTLHLVGAGVDDGGWGERAYQLYAVGAAPGASPFADVRPAP